ncbi:MAG: hypothetical protein C4560_04640 [Nitrospiraceae bacterium]|nr:MAG: hypothetical protein C4560_04640 [Nitrospiraceae bacterium]
MKRHSIFTAMIFILLITLVGMAPVDVFADGDEILGPPGITLASGSGSVFAGTGLFTQPGIINVNVPASATVKQALLYWYGRGGGGDNTIIVNSNNITGTLIGEDSTGLLPFQVSHAYRADITGLGLITPGANALSVSGLEFTYHNSGAGVIVIFDDGSVTDGIQLRDGHDFAAVDQGFNGTLLETTVPQVFIFPAAAAGRQAALDLFVADGEADRPDAIEITVGGAFSAANVIDFEDIDLGGADYITVGPEIISRGFSIVNPGSMFIIGSPSACGGICADNGSQTLIDPTISTGGGPLIVSNASGLPFVLQSVDIAEGVVANPSFPKATSITVTGALLGGGSISETFILDGVIDGPGGQNDFQTFSTSLLAGKALTSATFTAAGPSALGDGAFSIDNINVAGPAGGVTSVFYNVIKSSNEPEWDTLKFLLDIPAGETMVRVKVKSYDDGSAVTPDSIAWIAAGLSILGDQAGEGCTPGYWKQSQHFDSWTPPYTPDTLFSAVFENAFTGMTLLQVLEQGGGGLNALGRHTVAALLNAASQGVDYDLSVSQVIATFNNAFPGTTTNYNSVKDWLERYNEQGCPLD